MGFRIDGVQVSAADPALAGPSFAGYQQEMKSSTRQAGDPMHLSLLSFAYQYPVRLSLLIRRRVLVSVVVFDDAGWLVVQLNPVSTRFCRQHALAIGERSGLVLLSPQELPAVRCSSAGRKVSCCALR